jgi:hypothetical protein
MGDLIVAIDLADMPLDDGSGADALRGTIHRVRITGSAPLLLQAQLLSGADVVSIPR